MKYKTFTSPSLILFTILMPTAILLIPFVFGCVLNDERSFQNAVVLLVTHIALNFILFLFFHRAFFIVTVDTHGVKTNNVKIAWDEVRNIDTFEVTLFKYNIQPSIHISFICISKDSVTCSFWVH